MAAKKKPDKNTINVKVPKDADAEKQLTSIKVSPEFQAASTIINFNTEFDYNAKSLLDELESQVKAVNDGDMHHAESILLMQAHTLNEMFNHLARRAFKQEYLKHYEAFLKLALKAQAQSRATLEALSNIKNPPVVYAKQANISNGPQQINNGVPVEASHAEEIQNQPNELLEVKNGERLDTRATQETIGSDTAMAALG